jgi:hypothetical protein
MWVHKPYTLSWQPLCWQSFCWIDLRCGYE